MAAPSEAVRAPLAERRLVTVLFADLVGFTPFAEERDAEEVRETLTRYFELASQVIGRYGGTIEKFIGDAVMAVWGAPVAHEDDAERAVRSALELVDAVRGLGPTIQARAGVLTGEAAVTLGATNQGMVAGDLVNTAARLQSVAQPGTVLVGEATMRAASRVVTFEPAGDQALKGKASPVPAHVALRVVAGAGGRNRGQALEAPFVGRDDEFRLFKDVFHATGRDRRTRLVSVIGQAGIGKSRLAWELFKYVDGLVETTFWHSGRSPAYGDGITFWALGEMVRRRCQLAETDDEPTTRAKIAEAAGRWVPDEAERRWVEKALLALLGLGEPLPGGRNELFAAWRTFFERVAGDGTTVLIFEDLQWADEGMLSFIDHLMEWSHGLPIMIVTLARPELLERRPDLGAGRRNFVSLTLDPLSESAMRELLAGLVPGLPEPAVRAIVGRADGIPLYAVETVRMLVSDGRLKEQEGVYEPVGDLATLAVPETLTALIAARLDALDPPDRALLQDAAVLGQRFTVEGLGAIVGESPEALEPRLRALVRRELLILEADPRSPERGQFGFVQALLRDVAYNTLAKTERRSRHLAAARWYEQLGDDELAGVLAAQYVAAYRASPEGPEADALVVQARLALKGAATRAAALGSHGQAFAFLGQALEITDDERDRAQLSEQAGVEAGIAAESKAAQRLLEEAVAWYRAAGDRVGLARAATSLARVLASANMLVDAVKLLEPMLDEVGDVESEPEVVRLMAELSRAYANAHDLSGSLAMSERALTAAERLELMPVIVEALINRALALGRMGRAQESIVILRGVVGLAESHGFSGSQVRALNNLSAMLAMDDWRASQAPAIEGLTLARRLGDRYWMFRLSVDEASSMFWMGEPDEAIRLMDEIEPTEAPEAVQGYIFGVRSHLAALRGKDEEARSLLAASERYWDLTQSDALAGRRWDEGFVDLLAGRDASAQEAFREAVTVSPDDHDGRWWFIEWATRSAVWLRDLEGGREALAMLEARPERGRLRTAIQRSLQGAVLALAADRDAAMPAFLDAAGRLRDLDMPPHLGFCLLDFATLIGPDDPQAAAAADEAREIFTRIDSPPLLIRLDEGLAHAPRVADAAATAWSASPVS